MTQIGKVLVVGSNCVPNRTPTFLAELARRASAIRVLQRSYYYSARPSASRWVRALWRLVGSVLYHLELPVAVMRSDWVFLTASNNHEVLALAFWARRFRRPVLVDYYVSFFEWSCLMMKHLDPDSRVAKRYRKSDRVALEQAGVIHFNRCEIDHVVRLIEHPAPPAALEVIPLFSKFDQFAGELRPPRVGGPVRFIWWGSLMPLHGLELVLDAFMELASRRDGFELHLCFLDVSRATELLKRYGADRQSWLFVHDRLTMADGSLPRFVNEFGDIGFSHFGTGPQAECVGSNKIIEAMSLGRTSLVADTLGNRELPRLEELFLVCERSVPALAAKLGEVLDHPEVLLEKGRKCREEFVARYSSVAAERMFADVVDRFLARSWA